MSCIQSRNSIIIILVFAALITALLPAAVSQAGPDPVREAWEQAQKIGVYHYSTDILQTTIPQPVVTNTGQSPRQEIYHLIGDVDTPNRRLDLSISKDGDIGLEDSNVIEIQVDGGAALARTGSGDWQELDNPNDFAGSWDPLAFLFAARDLQDLGAGRRPLPGGSTIGFQRYSFSLDGPALAAQIRGQLEDYYRSTGQLPGGVELELPASYRDATGEGEIWLDEQGLPLRLTLDVVFPAVGRDQVKASIKTSFSGFGQAITLLDILRPETAGAVVASYFPPKAVKETAARAGMLSSFIFLILLLVALRRNKFAYAAGVLIVVLSMVLTPIIKSRQVQAFSRELDTGQALTPASFPARSFINSVELGPRAAGGILAAAQVNDGSAPADDPCQAAGMESDLDKDSLTCAQEISLGTDPSNPDTDGDLIPDALEAAGFDYQGQTWYTDPLNHDTNGDGLLDGLACPDRAYNGGWDSYTYSPVDTPCPDSDNDGTPDPLDLDLDGDRVPNDVDLSPMTLVGPTDSFGLIVDGLQAGQLTLVDLQIQPARDEHLWWALNVLDWPSGDEEGQIQRKTGNDTTYADLYPGGADPRFENGDMRLVPMLEITIPWDSVTLGNLPVRADAPEVITPATDLNQWLDNDELQRYGIAVKFKDDLGTLLAYVPLSYVMDSQGGARVSFSARIPYRPAGQQWGQAQQMRLVWLVHALTDLCTAQDSNGRCTAWSLNNEQIVQTYYEPFTLAGMAAREDLGANLAIVYQDPAAGQPAQEDALWSLAENLELAFLGGRDSDGDGQRDITVPELARRFNHTTNGAVSLEERWGINNTLSVETRQYPDRDEMLAALMASDVEPILESTFSTTDTPTLMFASEQIYRRAALDRQAVINGTSITLQLGGTSPSIMASLQWRPYAYQNGAWTDQPLAVYLDNLSLQVGSADPFFDPDAPGNDEETTALKLALLHSYYISLVQGLNDVVQDGNHPLVQDGLVPVDDWHLMHEELATGAKFQGYSKYIVKAAYMLRGWYQNRQIEQMMTRMGYQAVEDVGGIRRKLDKLFLQVQDQWSTLEASVQARWESMSTACRAGAVVGGGVLIAGIGVGLYCLISSDRDTANKVQIATAGLSTVMSTLSVIKTVNKIVKAGATTTNLTERLQAASEEVTESAKTMAVVGAIVAVGVTVGFFIYNMISAGVKAGSLEFDAALANTIATSVALVIMIAIAFIPVVGQLIAAVLGLIDALISLICGLAGEDASSSWVCSGITGWLAKGIAWAIYGQHVMIDLDNSDRLETFNFGTSFTADSNGFTEGSGLSYHVSVTNTIEKASFPADALALPYFWQWTGSRAKTSAFDYQITDGQSDVGISRGETTWRGDEPWTMTQAAASGPIPLPQAGLNRAIDGLYLNEGYAVPVQECWGLLVASVCYIRDETDTNHLSLGNNLKFDIFPATLDEFYTLIAKDNSYALVWGQDGSLTFPSLKDADGDGLLSKSSGGADPDDSHWDDDGDGLSDSFEVQNGVDPDNADTDLDGLLDGEELRVGTNPHLPDSDGDGLADGEEIEGWLFVYGFDGATPLKTLVRPDPLNVDIDGDNYNDFRERVFGFHPRVPSAGDILTLESTVLEPGPGGVYEPTDGYVRPGDQIRYQASVTNQLDERYAQGLLATEFPPATEGAVAPQSFVLHPLEQTTLTADIQVAAGASGGVVALTQEAQAQITDPRDLLGAPRIWLSFDEEAGAATFADGAGISPPYDAVCSGGACPAAGLAGLAGSAVEFDGIDDYLSINDFIFNTQVAAISAWVKPDTVAGAHGIVLRGDSANQHGMSFGIVDGQVWVGGNTGSGWSSNYAGSVPAGEWTHLAVVYREYSTAYWDHHRCEVYIGGEYVETFSDCPFQLDGSNYTTRIGNNPAGSTQYFDGLIDDLRIYTHAPSSWHIPALLMGFDQAKFADDSDYNNSVACEPTCPGKGSGISGQAASFDGHHYLDSGLPGVSFEQYTLSAWVFPTDTGGATDSQPQGVLGVNATTIKASPHLIVVGKQVRTGFATGTQLVQYTTGDVLKRNAWNHIVVTFGDTAGMVRVYVNGEQVASYNAGDKSPNQGSYFAKMTQVGSAGSLGDFNGSSALRLFNGRLDNVAIYREALTAVEINELYQSGAEAVVLAFDDPPGGVRSSDDPGIAHLMNTADGTGLHNATCQGDACPVLGVAGREWRAALFDGVNDVAILDNSKSDSFAFSGSSPVPFSLAAWVYPKAGGAIVSKFNTGKEGSYFLRVMDNGAVEFHRETPPWNLVTSSAIPFNLWSHVAGVFDGATLSIYINGALAASAANTGAIPSAPNTPVTIGALYENDTLSDWFSGMLDDVRIYRKALSSDEVGALFHSAPSLQISFDEAQGVSVFADAASGLDATCSGDACPSAGVKGQVSLAADLNGVDDYAQIPDNKAIDPGKDDDFSITLWVKPGPHQPDDGSGDNSIIEKWSAGQDRYPYAIRYLNQNSDDAGKVYAGRYDGAHNPLVTSAHAINDGEFHHIAFVKTGGVLYLYIDGELNDSTTDTTTTSTGNDLPLYIGQRGGGVNRFSGTVDELQFYDRGLSPMEIQDLFQAQVAMVEDRQQTYLSIDAEPPASILRSDHPYRANEPVQLLINAADSHSGVSGVELAVGGTWNEVPACQDAAGAAYCPTFTPSGEGRYLLQTRATDNSGNTETPAGATTFYIDAHPPEISVDHGYDGVVALKPDPEEATAWLVTFSGSASDPALTSGDPGSGVALVELALIDASGNAVQAGIKQAVVENENWEAAYPLYDPSPDGVFILRVRATDSVGNTGEWTEIPISIDGSPPEAGLIFPRVANTALFSATQAITQAGAVLSGVVSDTIGSIQTGLAILDVGLVSNLPGSPLYNDQAFAGDAVLEQQIVHLPFDDSPGLHDSLRFMDVSGRGNDAVCTGKSCPSPGIDGHQGTAIRLDSRDDAAQVSSPQDFPAGVDPYTLSAWIAPTETTGNIIGFNGARLLTQPHRTCKSWWIFNFCYNDGYRLNYAWDTGSISADAGNLLDKWHHMAVTYDGAVTTFYVDGAAQGSTAGGSLSMTANLSIGGTNSNGFSGKIDDLRIFTKALSAPEIKTLYTYTGSEPLLEIGFDSNRVWPDGSPIPDDTGWGRIVTAHAGSQEALLAGLGRVGSFALALDGQDDYVDLSAVGSYNSAEVTYALWVQPDSVDGPHGLIMRGGGNNGVRLGIDNGQVWVGGSRGSGWTNCYSGDISSGEWTHLAAIFHEASQTVDLYSNGQPMATVTGCQFQLDGDGWETTLGNNPLEGSQYFSGMIDDLRIYPRALSAAEIGVMAAEGWREGMLSQVGGLNARWTYTLTSGLEGHYQLGLRGIDNAGNAGLADQNLWSGLIDTLAPRVEITRTQTGGGYLITTVAQDFNLSEENFSSPCGDGVITERQNFTSPWYLARLAQDETTHQRLFQISSSCIVQDALPQTSTACDIFGHCTIATLNRNPDEAEVVQPIQIAFTGVPTAWLSLDPITLQGAITSTSALQTLTVTVGSAAVHTATWTLDQDVRQSAWSAVWLPPGEGIYTVQAAASDWADHNITETLAYPIVVDTSPPTITVTGVLTGAAFSSSGRLFIQGTVSDTVDVSKVMVTAVGELLDPPLTASVRNGVWRAAWDAGYERDLDGVTLIVTAEATDLAGHTTITAEPVIVDVEPPPLASLVLRDANSGLVVEPGSIITDPLTTLQLTWTMPPDGSGPGDSIVNWSVRAGNSYSQTTTIHPPGGPYTSELAAGEAQYVGVELGRFDSYGNGRWQTAGPVIVDGQLTPDVILMDDPADIYHGWMDNGCTLVGIDSRIQRKATEHTSLDNEQRLYATWDRNALRLAWTGANWNSDGDLFIYFDTREGGSARAYNPYPDTMDSTAILLPYDRETLAQMKADHMIWIKDSSQVVMLFWDGEASNWQEIPSDIEYAFEEQPGGGFTDLRIPFASLGIDDPANTPVSMAALASEDDVLRLWATMPPRSSLDSGRVLEQDAPGDLHLFALAQKYTWNGFGLGVCPNGLYDGGPVQLYRDDVSFELSADPPGAAYHLLRDNLFHLMPQMDPFAGHDWETVQAEFCMSNPGDPVCERPAGQSERAIWSAQSNPASITPPPGSGRQPAAAALVTEDENLQASATLNTYRDVDHPALSDGQRITYTLDYANLSDRAVTGLMLQVVTEGPLRLPAGQTFYGPEGAYDSLVINLDDIGAYQQKTIHFTGQVDTAFDPANNNGWASLDAVVYDADGTVFGNEHEWLYLDHEIDQSGPIVGVQAAPGLIGPGENTVRGYYFDQSPVPTVTLQIQLPGGQQIDQVCTDETPEDGSWTCAWNAPQVADGTAFNLRARGVDSHGQVGEWTKWIAMTQDIAPPEITLDTATQDALSDGVLGAAETTLRGSLRDNMLVQSVEVCRESAGGEACLPVQFQTNAGTIPQTTFIYEDIPAAPLPLGAAQACEPGQARIRTFYVEDSLTVAGLSVGLNLDHPYRADVNAWLVAPSGAWVYLLGSGTAADNYDVLLDDASIEPAALDRGSHRTTLPLFDNVRRPIQPLSTLNGEQAQGYWNLVMCDAYAVADDGQYNRGRLTLVADTVPQETRGSWQYALPSSVANDHYTHTLTFYGLDAAGNRTSEAQALKLTFHVDTIGPVVTPTQVLTTAPLDSVSEVLAGTIADGGGVGQILVWVQTPAGALYTAYASIDNENKWSFTLEPTLSGVYTLQLFATDQAGNTSTAGPFQILAQSTLRHKAYLPLVMGNIGGNQ